MPLREETSGEIHFFGGGYAIHERHNGGYNVLVMIPAWREVIAG